MIRFADRFPSEGDQLHAKWRAIQIEPIPASAERLTVGVAVIGPKGYQVKIAPGLERLRCLYDDAAGPVIEAAMLTMMAIEHHLASTELPSLEGFQAPFLSVHIGPERAGAGNSLSHVANQALSLSSSLSVGSRDSEVVPVPKVDLYVEVEKEARTDRLTSKVKAIVTGMRPGLNAAFNRPLRTAQVKRRAPVIGFVSARMVANFNSMLPGKIPASMAKVRNSLWALLLHRDLDALAAAAEHKVFVHRPRPSDWAQGARQLAEIDEACSEASFEASRQRLGVEFVHSADEIAQSILLAA
jgi:hypothetical protein